MRDTYTPTFQTKGERDEVREILPKGNNSYFCQTGKHFSPKGSWISV